MAIFEVPVVRIDAIDVHPNADRLMLARVGGYTCIVGKNEDGTAKIAKGALAAYIPAAAVMPEWLIRHLGLWDEEKGCGCGMLGGAAKNRVKAIRLRQVFSEGLLLEVRDGFIPVADGFAPAALGDDVRALLGVEKYEPPIPVSMSGQVFNLGRAPIAFDLEPIEKNQDLLSRGEAVSITEKIHGTMTGISIIVGLDHPEAFPCPWGSRDMIVWSKGLGGRGLVFKDVAENAEKLYIRVASALAFDTTPVKNGPDVRRFNERFWTGIRALMTDGVEEIHMLGETFGQGVQDLAYGAKTPAFRLFDIGLKGPAGDRWLCPGSIPEHAESLGAKPVPLLYEGPFDADAIPALRDGKTTLDANHIREGVVIKRPGVQPVLGRLALKAVSPQYKLRANGTEFN